MREAAPLTDLVPTRWPTPTCPTLATSRTWRRSRRCCRRRTATSRPARSRLDDRRPTSRRARSPSKAKPTSPRTSPSRLSCRTCTWRQRATPRNRYVANARGGADALDRLPRQTLTAGRRLPPARRPQGSGERHAARRDRIPGHSRRARRQEERRLDRLRGQRGDRHQAAHRRGGRRPCSRPDRRRKAGSNFRATTTRSAGR